MKGKTKQEIKEALSTSQVARLLGLTRERVIQLSRIGELRPVMSKIGRLFDPAEVSRFAQERRR